MNPKSAERERRSIIIGLGSRDDELRRLAVERVLALPPSDAIPRLVTILGDSSWRVRKAGVERLVACGEIDTVTDALIAALSDSENPGRRNSAVEALVSVGAQAIPKLIESLGSDDVDVRKLAFDSIAGIGDGAGRRAMIESLRDRDPNVRAAAADALGVIGGEGAELILRSLAVHESEEQLVRLSCLRALASLDAAPAVSDLSGALAEPILAGAAYTLLGNLGDDEAVAYLLKGLGDRSRVGRESAMKALLCVLSRRDCMEFESLVSQIREAAQAHPRLLDSAIDRLPEADLATRLVMVQFLGLVGEPSCVLAILEAGRDEAMAEVAFATLSQLGDVSEAAIDRAWEQLDDASRRDACHLLGGTAGPRAIERLLEALASTDLAQRVAAAAALAACGCCRALEPLLDRLEIAACNDDAEDEEECDLLVDALVALCGAVERNGGALVGDAVAFVSGRLEGANERTRLAIARILGRIGRSEDATLVVPLSKDASSAVRCAAVEALSRLSPDGFAHSLRLALADESHEVRIVAASALARSVYDSVLEDLERLVRDEDWRVRVATLRAIGAPDCVGLAQEEKLALLETALADVGAVCLVAVEALAKVGGARSVCLAASVLTRPEPELVQAAVACLGAHGEQENLLDLLPLVSHTNWAVRADAIDMLAGKHVTQALPSILRRLETEQDAFVRDSILHGLNRLEAWARE